MVLNFSAAIEAVHALLNAMNTLALVLLKADCLQGLNGPTRRSFKSPSTTLVLQGESAHVSEAEP